MQPERLSLKQKNDLNNFYSVIQVSMYSKSDVYMDVQPGTKLRF